MADTKISQLAPGTWKPSLLIPAIDETRPTSDQNVAVSGSGFAINLIAGANITITDNLDGSITISAIIAPSGPLPTLSISSAVVG